jgi:hypothetical protein
MQISGSTLSYSSYTSTSKSLTGGGASEPSMEKSFYADLADYDSTDNTLFQNLLKDPTVQDNVLVDEDGTYSFVGIPSNDHEHLLSLLIAEQNGDYSDPGGMSSFSSCDIAKFRQLAGYNLVQAAGMFTVVDDNGDAPAAGDLPLVQAAWSMFDLAKGVQDLNNPGSDLSPAELSAAAQHLGTQAGANRSAFDALMSMIDEGQAL